MRPSSSSQQINTTESIKKKKTTIRYNLFFDRYKKRHREKVTASADSATTQCAGNQDWYSPGHILQRDWENKAQRAHAVNGCGRLHAYDGVFRRVANVYACPIVSFIPPFPQVTPASEKLFPCVIVVRKHRGRPNVTHNPGKTWFLRC